MSIIDFKLFSVWLCNTFVILKLSIKSCICDTFGIEGDGDVSMHELRRLKQRKDSGRSEAKTIYSHWN